MSSLGVFGITLTVVVWFGARNLQSYVTSKFLKPFFNPVFLSISVIIGILQITGVNFDDYNTGASWVSFFLYPAVVSMAVLVIRYIHVIRLSFWPLIFVLIVSSIVGIITAVEISAFLGCDEVITKSMAAKSVTTPIAMGITEAVGGIPALTAAVVIVTGILGAMFGPELLNAINIRNRAAVGLAMGLACHGIGTTRVIEDDVNQDSKIASSMSSLAMVLNGFITAVLVPIILPALLKFNYK